MSGKKSSEKGNALVIVLVVVVIGAVFTLALGTWVTSNIRQTALRGRQEEAYYIAKSSALSFLDWVVEEDSAHLADIFKQDLNDDGEITEEDNRSTGWQQFGNINNKEYRLNVRIDDEDKLHLNAEARVDSEQLRNPIEVIALPEGTAEGTTLDSSIIATNSIKVDECVTIKNHGFIINKNPVVSEDVNFVNDVNPNISGNVLVGESTEESVMNMIGAKVDAVKKLPGLRLYTLPLFPNFPEENNLVDKGDIIINNNTSSSDKIITENSNFDTLTITDDQNLTIEVGKENMEIRIGSLILNDGKILLTNTEESMGKVSLYVEDEIDFKDNTESSIEFGEFSHDLDIDAASLRKNLIIYYKGSADLNLGGVDQYIVGDIYSQMANVNLSGTANLYGYLISGGEEVNIDGGTVSFYQQSSDTKPLNSNQFPRLIYAPKSRIAISSPNSNNNYDKITGTVLGRDVIVGPNFKLVYFRSNVSSTDLDFRGGRKYTNILWSQDQD